MRNTTFGMLALAVTMLTAGPLLAQSANRTGSGAPAPTAKKSATLSVETLDVAKCRQHCQTLPSQSATGHFVRTVAEADARYTACARTMVVR